MSGRTLASRTVLVCSLGLSASPLFSGVRMVVREGLPIVDGVYVNGHGPYRFLVDTGTNINLIAPRLAKKIGMTASFQDELRSPAGMTRLPGSDGNEIELGPIKATGQRVLFSETVHSVLPDVQGVLGQWFLSEFDYMLDMRGKRLEFGKQNLTGRRSPLKMVNGRTAVSTSLGNLVLDSGAVRLVRFGVDPVRGDQDFLQTVGGLQIVGRIFSRLIIEGRTIWNGDAVAIPSRTEPGIAGLLPLSLFRTVFVCNSEGYAIFE